MNVNPVSDDTSIHEWINPPGHQILTHDPVHDSFYLPQNFWKIIDKPEFQRLRGIKQNGNTCYVYIGAEHTRFSHCLGVSHLCLEFAKTIQRDNPTMLTDKHVQLLGVAGLVHDLGHCAYSHLYDGCIVPKFEPGSDFSHERASYQIFVMMCTKYQDLKEIYSIEDIQTVGKLIFGSKNSIPAKYNIKWSVWDETHPFYYEILSNKRTGIDVDKFDYIKRDSHFTGVKTTFESKRLINFYYIDKVLDRCSGQTKYYLEYQPKVKEIIEVMWQSRNDLHRRVYQHRVVKCIDLMMAEIIILCGHQYIPGTQTLLCNAHHDMESYCKITDSMIRYMVLNVPEAKAIINAIDNRNLWKTLAIIDSNETLVFDFTDPNVVVSVANLRDSNIYYIYYKNSIVKLDKIFYRELIKFAQGANINMRHDDTKEDRSPF